MQALTSVLRKIGTVLLMGLLARTGLAVVDRNDIIVGDNDRVQQQVLQLPAGSYRVQMFDPFGATNNALFSAGALLAHGTENIGELQINADLYTDSINVDLQNSHDINLFVHVDTLQKTGAVVVSVESLSGVTAGNIVFEKVFSFSHDVPDNDEYLFDDSVKVTGDSILHFDLADMHALSLGVFAPFESVVVRVANVASTQTLQTWCWYKGNVSAADASSCVDMDTLPEPEFGQTLSQDIAVSKGFVAWYVAAKAPIGKGSQLGWNFRNVSSNSDLGEDVVIVNKSGNNYAQEVGEFTLNAGATVSIALTPLSETIAAFKLALIGSADGISIPFDNATLAVQDVRLPEGRYRFLLSDALSGDKGLLGIRVTAGSARLYDDAFSLGDFQRFGHFELAGETAANFVLKIFEAHNLLDIKVVSGAGIAAELNAENSAFSAILPAGQYGAWGKYKPLQSAGEDDLYRVAVTTGSSLIGEFVGSSAERLVMQKTLALPVQTYVQLSTHNFQFPDQLTERYRLILTQGDLAPLKFDVDNNDINTNHSATELNAGKVQVALFASQLHQAKATVIGYDVEYDAVDKEEGAGTPPRNANGSGGKRGGGSVGSFLLYLFLAFKIVWQRRERQLQQKGTTLNKKGDWCLGRESNSHSRKGTGF